MKDNNVNSTQASVSDPTQQGKDNLINIGRNIDSTLNEDLALAKGMEIINLLPNEFVVDGSKKNVEDINKLVNKYATLGQEENLNKEDAFKSGIKLASTINPYVVLNKSTETVNIMIEQQPNNQIDAKHPTPSNIPNPGHSLTTTFPMQLPSTTNQALPVGNNVEASNKEARDLLVELGLIDPLHKQAEHPENNQPKYYAVLNTSEHTISELENLQNILKEEGKKLAGHMKQEEAAKNDGQLTKAMVTEYAQNFTSHPGGGKGGKDGGYSK